ncbi:hypothetical protein D3C77_562230 [compost metagenome]
MQLAHLGFAGNVTGNEQRLAARRPNQRHRGLATDRVEVSHHYLQALLGEGQGRCPANAGSATGNQGYLAGKGHAHHVLLKGLGGAQSIVSHHPSGQHHHPTGWATMLVSDVDDLPTSTR